MPFDNDQKRACDGGASPGAVTTAAARETLVCVIQARRTSKRLPDKIFADLAGKPILQHVIERVQMVPSISRIVVASPDAPESTKIVELAKSLGVDCFLGSEHDVLKRFFDATGGANAQHVMRVTADCPLINPGVCQELYDLALKENADYTVTTHFPHGLDCEVFTGALLKTTHERAEIPEDREHVTLWMKANRGIKTVYMECPDKALAHGQRWVVDYPEDLQFLRVLFESDAYLQHPFDYARVAAFISGQATLKNINTEQAKTWNTATQALKPLLVTRDTSEA